MLRWLRHLTISIFITLFSLVFVFSAPVFAIDPPGDLDELLEQAGSEKYLQEFCGRRNDNQMNLETWYSGKCLDEKGEPLDPFSGEGVGFSSIVLLDLAEKINGKKAPDKKFGDFIFDFVKFVIENKNVLSSSELNNQIFQKRMAFFRQNNTGLTSGVGKGLALLLTTPPASTKSYIADIGQNLQRHHIIPQAQAQTQPELTGYGFSALSPFLPIWKAFRNIAYVVFILAFIVYGFMMMFRVNISAKTAITIQLAIPKLIATLLMITFSYAIVGLMVDLMYVLFYAILSILESQKLVYTGNWFVKAASGQWGMIMSVVTNTFFSLPASAIGIVNLIIGGPAIISLLIASLLGPVFGFLIAIILSIAILISYIKLFLKLITAFLSVVISLVTAPIILLGNVLPGSDSFGPWIRGIFANLSVFPITMVLLLFSYMLMVQPLIQDNIITTSLPTLIADWAGFVGDDQFFGNPLELLFGVKDLVGNNNPIQIPLVTSPLASSALGSWGSNSASALMALLGVALLLMASKYVDIVRDALKVPPFKYGGALTDALKGGVNLNAQWADSGYKGMPRSFRKSGFAGDMQARSATLKDTVEKLSKI